MAAIGSADRTTALPAWTGKIARYVTHAPGSPIVGERIWNLERKFNMDAGLTAADDTLPKRLLKDAAKTGPAKGKVNELHKMLPHYYEIRGWTTDGVPTQETLLRLGEIGRAHV